MALIGSYAVPEIGGSVGIANRYDGPRRSCNFARTGHRHPIPCPFELRSVEAVVGAVGNNRLLFDPVAEFATTNLDEGLDFVSPNTAPHLIEVAHAASSSSARRH